MKTQVNVIKMIPTRQLEEGAQYFFIQGNAIHEGTAVKCEKCGKWCSVNSVMITSFDAPVVNIAVADITDDELSYCEATKESLCSDCIN